MPELFASVLYGLLVKVKSRPTKNEKQLDNDDGDNSQPSLSGRDNNKLPELSTTTTLTSHGESPSTTIKKSYEEPASAPIPQLMSEQDISINIMQQRFVFLAVSQGEDYCLGELEVQGLEDDCFFQHLRAEYFKQRGYLYRWFSIWAYDHCDFVMVSVSGLVVSGDDDG